MKLKILLLGGVFIALNSLSINAQNFSSIDNKSGKIFFYKVIDEKNHQVAIVKNDKPKATNYAGVLTIPESVKFLGKDYIVKEIAENAFSNCDSINKIYLPASIDSIAKNAFFNCTNLSGVTFSAKQVRVDEKAFSECVSIENVTIGGDWNKIDMKIFADSKKLAELYIPAKVKIINNLKDLKKLSKIDIDSNNPYYSSINGLLLNKANTELLICPVGKKGELKIPEGVKVIRKGSLVNAKELTQIDFPSTLETLYFRELYRLINLKRITFRSEKVINTALDINNNPVFVLEIDVDKDFKILVPSKAKKLYSKICSEEGYYKEIGNDKSESVLIKDRKLAKSKMISGVKKF